MQSTDFFLYLALFINSHFKKGGNLSFFNLTYLSQRSHSFGAKNKNYAKLKFHDFYNPY